MTIIFVVNKVIGRDYIGAVDAGAYFGLTVARALYNPAHAKVFLWIFWPSFNGATLAGGVTVGACVDMMLTPGGSVAINVPAGILSVCGFQYIQPCLLDKLRIHDSC